MEKNSKFKPFYSLLEQYVKEGSIPPKYGEIIREVLFVLSGSNLRSIPVLPITITRSSSIS